MAQKIIITNRFRKNVQSIYTYISKKFSSRIAFLFLDKIETRVEFISRYPEAGKLSQKKKNIRCVQLTPHNFIYYRVKKGTIEILCLFDMRRNPTKRPY